MTTMTTKRAIVLLSGGLDSATVLAIAKSQGFDCYALSFSYGQRHVIELERAKSIASAMGVIEHVVVDFDLRRFGGSALTSNMDVPKDSVVEKMATTIPVTYVPARNTIFLSFSLAWAETVGAHDIFLGVNALDFAGYPDCRPEYIASFERMANLATKAGVEGSQAIRLQTPLITLSKAEIIQLGSALGVDYSMTSSCYDPGTSGKPCGKCDACLLRAQGFAVAKCVDPLAEKFSK